MHSHLWRAARTACRAATIIAPLVVRSEVPDVRDTTKTSISLYKLRESRADNDHIQKNEIFALILSGMHARPAAKLLLSEELWWKWRLHVFVVQFCVCILVNATLQNIIQCVRLSVSRGFIFLPDVYRHTRTHKHSYTMENFNSQEEESRFFMFPPGYLPW